MVLAATPAAVARRPIGVASYPASMKSSRAAATISARFSSAACGRLLRGMRLILGRFLNVDQDTSARGGCMPTKHSFVRQDKTFLSEGTACAAWLYRPDGVANPPIVVLAHGFAAFRDLRLDAYAERFAQAGYAALVFDYRHWGASEGEPQRVLDIGRQHADWRAAVAYARSLGGVDTAR